MSENVIVPSRYLTACEAAEYLRTSLQGIYGLVKRRRIFPMPGSPGRLLFTRESLDRFLAGKPRKVDIPIQEV
jgi:excisionase family DNA binding protein